jgi:ribulose-phosphate 3-epimerase
MNLESPLRRTIIPAVIAGSQEELERMLAKIAGHSRQIQLDVMDGLFVPSRSLDFPLHLPAETDRFEAHLMVRDPETWIDAHGLSVGTIIPHFESHAAPADLIRKIKGMNRRAGMAINPGTDVDSILPYIQSLDQVLVMTVNPGFYGSPFLPETLEKVRRIRHMRPDLDIEVDGGIKPQTIGQAKEAGANLFVSGSYLLLAADIAQNIAILQAAASF